MVRDFCIRGIAAVQLGLGRNDQFFCSQFILEAYRSAGLPLTDADPRLINPGDLLHMREGDVPSIMIHKPLRYVGHLKAAPQMVAAEQLERSPRQPPTCMVNCAPLDSLHCLVPRVDEFIW